MDLFDQNTAKLLAKNSPLADRMRPRTLDEFIGQEHIVGPGRLLRRAIEADQLSSLIFYGPPGTGKTTLARIIANTTKAQFLSINAVLAGVKEIRDSIQAAQETLKLFRKRTILFVDEVHRFNKSQQDALLPHVENGTVILIGATTENPYFEVNKALVSRSRIFQLKGLLDEDLRGVAKQALHDVERGFGSKQVQITNDALDHLVSVANGDARGVLNALELAIVTTKPDSAGVIHIDRAIAEESIQQRAVLYDKDGDAHYDTISAFIKSVRGSDPDAALYWMAKMVYAGEDPRFIFRRMIILACEDVGMADPHALTVVMSAAQAFDYVGMPEGRYHLAHACLYLSTAPKSNSSMAFFDALNNVSNEVTDDVPNPLRDASRDKEGFGHGEGYMYPHAYKDHWVAQQYLPSALQGKVFYQPSDIGYEATIRESVARYRQAQIEAMAEDNSADLFVKVDAIAGNNQWHTRTTGATGDQLRATCSKVCELANIQRDSMVLDLVGRTGMLAFEAARIAIDGSVYVIAHDEQSYQTLEELAKPFSGLCKPQIVRATIETFDAVLKKSYGNRIRFDVIVGRNALTRLADKAEVIKRAAALLTKTGRCVLAEAIPALGQRISSFFNENDMLEPLVKTFVKIETELFDDPQDAMINWNVRTLLDSLKNVNTLTIKNSESVQTKKIKLPVKDVSAWFQPSKVSSSRTGLGDRLSAVLGPAEIETLCQCVCLRICNRDIEWKNVIGFFVIEKK